MVPEDFLFQAFFVVLAFVGATNKKAVAPTIVTAIALVGSSPDVEKAGFVMLLYIPAVILAQFFD